MARNQIAAEEESEAAIELSLLSFDTVVHNLKRSKSTPAAGATTFSWWKSTRYYAVAWIDPNTKQSTGPVTPVNTSRRSNKNKGKAKRKLYFPISPTTIGTPESPSIVTIQIISHCRLPFHGGRVVGTAVIPLSSVKLSAETFVLPLLRGSGEVRGSVSVSARILWDLGFRGNGETTGSSVVEEDDFVGNYCDCETVGSSESVYGGNAVVPSAPPEPLLRSCVDGIAPAAPPMDDHFESKPMDNHFESKSAVAKPEATPSGSEEGESFMFRLVLGAIAAVVLGVFCSNWRSKSISPFGRSQ